MLEKCKNLDDSYVLPDGCSIVKIYLTNNFIEQIRIATNANNDDELTRKDNNNDDEISEFDLTMDDLVKFDLNTTEMNEEKNQLNEIILYIQKSSRLKLILISENIQIENNENFKLENILKFVSKLMTICLLIRHT